MNVAIRSECMGVETSRVNVNGDVLAFDHGRMYLIMEERLDKAITIARDFVASGYEMLCVSRYHPEILRGLWGEGEFHAIWLSDRLTPNSIAPNQLNRISRRIEAFVSSHSGGVVMLDGIEYLSLSNDFSKLLRFVEELNDLIMESSSILLISVDPRSFDERSLARLRRFSELVY
jgi:hypothetical protein